MSVISPVPEASTASLTHSPRGCNVSSELPTGKTPGQNLVARWITREELNARRPEWTDLAIQAIHRNPIFEPEFLLPALQHLATDETRLLIVENTDDSRQLAGLLPCCPTRVFRLPWKAIQVWKHEQFFNTTPLLRRGVAPHAWLAVLQHLRSEGYSFLELDTVSAEPDFDDLLNVKSSIFSGNVFRRQVYDRAAIYPMDSAESYQQTFVSTKFRKKLRRLLRKLEQQGTVSFEFATPDQVPTMTEEFLMLEKSGWKGRNGTALASHSNSESYFRELMSSSTSDRQARLLALRVNGQAIAILADWQSGRNVYAYKTAYDESFAEFSPGMQIEYKNLEYLHADEIEFADSCTAHDSVAVSHVWGQTTKFQTAIVSLKPGLPNWLTSWMPMAQKLIRRWRTAKN